MTDFRDTEEFQLAKKFYSILADVSLPSDLNRQLKDALSSIAMNIAEGIGKSQEVAYFKIAAGSLCEVMAALELAQEIGQFKDDKKFVECESIFVKLYKKLSGKNGQGKLF